MTGAAEFLGARIGEGAPGGTCEFSLGRELHGAFGGVFGGAVSAATLFAARTVAEGRRPFSLHCTFLRALSTPTARATAEVVSAGRTVTTVAVDLFDAADRVAARSTVTFAAPEALHPFDADGALEPPELQPYEEGRRIPSPAGLEAPVMDHLDVRLVGRPAGGFAHSVPVPWKATEDDAAEAVCLIADFCVGIPVGAAFGSTGTRVPVPNPDLSLRFVGTEVGEVITGIGRLARIDRGVAGTEVEVWSEGRLLAIGLSSAVALGGGGG